MRWRPLDPGEAYAGTRPDRIRDSGSEGRVRVACIANVVATALAGVVYFAPTFSNRLLLLGFPWGITAPAFMLLLALALRGQDTPHHV